MRRVTLLSLIGLMLVMLLTLGCVALSAGVQAGAVPEQIYRFPPGSRYQLIVRLGSDGNHWRADARREKALNLWVHGQRTDWHYVNIIRIPLGTAEEDAADQ